MDPILKILKERIQMATNKINDPGLSDKRHEYWQGRLDEAKAISTLIKNS